MKPASQWIRHTVQALVLLVIVTAPFVVHYRVMLNRSEIELIRNQDAPSLPRTVLLGMDDLIRGDSGSGSTTERDALVENLGKISGNTWSAKIFGLSWTDPLAGAESMAASKAFGKVLIAGLLIPILGTLILGRVFCSWICPAGFLFETSDRIRRLLIRMGLPVKEAGFTHDIKYILLVTGLLISLLVGIPLLSHIYPPAVLGREIQFIVDSFFYGLAEEPLRAGAIALTGGSLFLFLVVLLEVFVARRMWCRYLCPGGALYAMLGRWRLARIVNNTSQCTHCAECVKVCPIGLNPMTEASRIECDNCLACLSSCQPHSLSLRITLGESKRMVRKGAQNTGAVSKS